VNMQHARKDYTERIQDSAHLIPDEEPVFLVLGRDMVGAATVRAWAHLNKVNGGSDVCTSSAMRQADRMEAWASKHGKIADLPKEGDGLE